jgi:hypothetical protein
VTYIYLDGKFEPDEGYQRGPMIVYTEKEWRRRVEKHIRLAHIRWMARGTLLMMSLPIMFMMFFLRFPDFENRDTLLWLAVLLAAINIVMFFVLTYYQLRALSRGPLYGLYEKGFQHNYSRFYPYEEIERVERRKEGWRSELVPYMYIRYGPGHSGEVLTWTPVRFIYGFLGEEGMRELEKRVEAEGPPD